MEYCKRSRISSFECATLTPSAFYLTCECALIGTRSTKYKLQSAITSKNRTLQLVREKLSLLFSETVHDRRHAPIEIARTHLVRVS